MAGGERQHIQDGGGGTREFSDEDTSLTRELLVGCGGLVLVPQRGRGWPEAGGLQRADHDGPTAMVARETLIPSPPVAKVVLGGARGGAQRVNELRVRGI